jgi:hypothetical protein
MPLCSKTPIHVVFLWTPNKLEREYDPTFSNVTSCLKPMLMVLSQQVLYAIMDLNSL